MRRFLSHVEASIAASLQWVVFEPNTAATWIAMKSVVERYLTGLWRAGAMQGPKPSEAFFVRIGLGETMTAVNVLEGRVIAEVGVAAVRPAEFIVVRLRWQGLVA